MTSMTSHPLQPRAAAMPMSPEAFDAVRAEVASLRAAGGDADLDGGRLPKLMAALGAAQVERDPGVAAVGRRVDIELPGGSRETYRLVLPGDGEPERGWIAIDAPLGTALAGRRRGDQVRVDAPAGGWAARIVEVR